MAVSVWHTTVYLQVVIDRLLASESLYQDAGKIDGNEDESKSVKDTAENANEPEQLESRRPVR